MNNIEKLCSYAEMLTKQIFSIGIEKKVITGLVLFNLEVQEALGYDSIKESPGQGGIEFRDLIDEIIELKEKEKISEQEL